MLRYLPTDLSTPEIARELSVSPNTVKTHIRHLYDKFGTHHRAEAVDLARSLGLLAPQNEPGQPLSAHRPPGERSCALRRKGCWPATSSMWTRFPSDASRP